MTTDAVTPGPAGAAQACWGRIGVWGDGSCPELSAAVHCRNCPVYAEAGRGLLERPAPGEYLAEWSRALTTTAAVEDRGSAAVLVFRVGSEWFALDIALCAEVVEARDAHRVPHRRDPVFLGVVNVRGELKLCLSLAGLLGIDAVGTDAVSHIAYPRHVVIEADNGTWVFAADEVHGVHRYRSADLTPPPVTVGSKAFVTAVIEWEGRSAGLLDGEALVNEFVRRIS